MLSPFRRQKHPSAETGRSVERNRQYRYHRCCADQHHQPERHRHDNPRPAWGHRLHLAGKRSASGAGGVRTITGIVSPGLSVDTTITNTAATTAFVIDENIGNNSSRAGVIMIRPQEVYLPLVLKAT